MRPGRAAAAATLVVLLLGLAAVSCGGGSSDGDAGPSEPSVTIVDLEPYAVEASDLPAGFEQKQRQTEETAAACFRPADEVEKKAAADIAALGLIGCQAVTYAHTAGGDSDQAGTFALLFRDEGGAQGALTLVRDILVKSYRATGDAKVVAVTEIPAPVLGDQALPGQLFKVQVGEKQTDHSIYLWRRGKVVDVFAAADFLGQLTPDAARDIAAKIDARAAR
jgi:hypothetical protein